MKKFNFQKIAFIFLCLVLVYALFSEGFQLYEGLQSQSTSNTSANKVDNNATNNLQQTSCTQFYDCKSCVNGQVNSSSSPCYWNKSSNKCGSFSDPGYSRTC
jgi:hypothetical protein